MVNQDGVFQEISDLRYGLIVVVVRLSFLRLVTKLS